MGSLARGLDRDLGYSEVGRKAAFRLQAFDRRRDVAGIVLEQVHGIGLKFAREAEGRALRVFRSVAATNAIQG